MVVDDERRVVDAGAQRDAIYQRPGGVLCLERQLFSRAVVDDRRVVRAAKAQRQVVPAHTRDGLEHNVRAGHAATPA